MDEIQVIVSPPVPDELSVEVGPPPPNVDVELWQVALAGRNGLDGDDGGATAIALQAHIDSPTPHAIYDDGPSLALLYENAKV